MLTETKIAILANNQLGDQLGWTFRNFKLQEATWKQQVGDKISAIMYSHLFNGRQEIWKAMQRDFYLAIATAKISDVEKRIMKIALDNLTVESLQVIFSRKNAMEATEFLSKCIFINRVLQQLAEMFKACMHQMTYGERSRLAIFITGNEYFGRKVVTVDFVDRNDDPLITASTCFEKLNLPRYKDLDTIYCKICYSTMDMSFRNI
jgi:hypothetical protein